MEYGLYSIRDKKIGYGDPIVLNNDEVALRAFKEWVNSPNINQANQFLEDKELYKIGTFDLKTGELKSENTYMAAAIDVKVVTPIENYKKRIAELEKELEERKKEN